MLFVFGICISAVTTPASAQSPAVVFTCPPCGCEGDQEYSEGPGQCTHCSMTTVATYRHLAEADKSYHKETARKRVAILVFDGVQIIDFTGPYEVFGQAGMEVVTVSPEEGMITTSMGMQVQPSYHFGNCPEADIVVLPGGGVSQHLDNESIRDWVQKRSQSAETTLSVCNGAFFLADAGLLDGKTATTFAALIPRLREMAPQATVVEDQRFVDNGGIVTSAGLSSGIDAALYVVSEHLGMGWAQQVATNLEYNWDPSGKYVRAALADKYLRDAVAVLRQFEGRALYYHGDRNHWSSRYRLKTSLGKNDLQRLLMAHLKGAAGWKLQPDGQWTVPVEDPSTSWSGTFELTEEASGIVVALQVEKVE
jgi:putative intracellular protease/amidase